MAEAQSGRLDFGVVTRRAALADLVASRRSRRALDVGPVGLPRKRDAHDAADVGPVGLLRKLDEQTPPT